MSRYQQFHEFRDRLNTRILGTDRQRGSQPDGSPRHGATLRTKQFFGVDSKTYQPGALDAKTKHLLGLVASMALRCDDCIAYHIDEAAKAGATDEELWESFDVALIVGGSIVIPHLRRAVEFLDQFRQAHG